MSALAPQALPVNLDFEGEQLYELNLSVQQAFNVAGTIQTVYVENGSNPNNVAVRSLRTGFRTVVPAYANAYLPIVSIEGDTLTFYSLGGVTSGEPVKAVLYNYSIQPFVWYTTDPLAPGFQVEVIEPTATSYTPKDKVLVAGVAFDVFGAAASPRYCVFANYTNEAAYYVINGTATGALTDQQIQPGERVTLPFRTPWKISFYSVNGGLIEAYEWTAS
jgi:hypothetical protein